jgi:hypothetical protein
MATPTDAPTNALPGIEITDDIVKSEREFAAEITVDENLNGDYGPQWHFAMKPLEYDLNTKTGCYHEYVSTDKRGARTKFGIIMSSLLLALGSDRPKQFGAGQFIGMQLMFLEKDFTFGKDRDTGEPIIRPCFLFLRKFTDDDKARIAARGTTLTQTPTSTFTDDEIAAIVSVVAGETEASATAKAARSKLPQNLKASVLSGTAIPALISQGKLALDGDKLVDASAAA